MYLALYLFSLCASDRKGPGEAGGGGAWGGIYNFTPKFILLSQNSSSESPNRGVMCQASRPDLQGQLTQEGSRFKIFNCQVLKCRSVLRKSVCTRKRCFAKKCMTCKGLADHPWSLK